MPILEPRHDFPHAVNLGRDLHLGGILAGTESGDLSRGWVHHDGETTSVRRWDVSTAVADRPAVPVR